MQQYLRPYVTAGIAIVGSGLIAATPVAAPPADVPAFRDVALAAGGTLPDALAPWQDVFNAMSTNATQLANNFFLAPAVGLQQFIANQAAFFQQIFDDPANIPNVMNEMQTHLKAVNDAFTLLGADASTITTTTLHTLNPGFDVVSNPDGSIGIEAGHAALFQLLPNFLPADQAATLTPIIDFLASPASAMIIGALGPSISPWVALANSLTDGDGIGQTLANMFGAYFNGATLNLDGLIPLIEQSGLLPLPAGTTLNSLSFAFGGMLSGGEVSNAPYQLFDSSGDSVVSIPAVGGSIFNSLGLNITASLAGTSLPLNVDPVAIGPWGAWEAWSQTVAGLLGGQAWAWDGKNGTPPPAEPPLSGFSIPTIPDSFFDGGAAGGAAAASSSAVEEFLSSVATASDVPDWMASIITALGG
ncbi:outer membrane porin GjpA [[Mycobacterium] nativiensis]|uniref:Outer membrane porin GjpA n=1 Tax=[Mycobacterium] nativiensis TaxID=2855503 RepID=A0ABU5Y1G9_9MYCO|nr:outer membrane porin GjpA [Mycolicibacter sp. MYC340]MEB3034099.1 outer membrane porin GjpA [Mycolicibacter sp. MYC340]